MQDQYGDGWLRMMARLTILPSRMLKWSDITSSSGRLVLS
jgi:hypothetical protein